MRRWVPRCFVLDRAHIYFDMNAPCVLASQHPASATGRAIFLNRVPPLVRSARGFGNADTAPRAHPTGHR